MAGGLLGLPVVLAQEAAAPLTPPSSSTATELPADTKKAQARETIDRNFLIKRKLKKDSINKSEQEQLKILAEQGDIEAQCDLVARVYMKEKPKEVLPWLLRAAEVGLAKAQYLLASEFYRLGEECAEYGYRRQDLEVPWDVLRPHLGKADESLASNDNWYSERWRWTQEPVPMPLPLSEEDRKYRHGVSDFVAQMGGTYSLAQQFYQLAADWYYRAAVQGYTAKENEVSPESALNTLSMMKVGVFKVGILPSLALRKSDSWEKAARENNDALAQYYLGKCCLHGWGCVKNKEEAVRWLKQSAEQGVAKAQYELAMCYEQAGNADTAEIVKWYGKAAEQGIVEALYRVGTYYLWGKGVEKKPQEAVSLLTKAAEQGHARAQYRLADCYMYGRGTAQNAQAAVDWFTKAANQGLHEATTELAKCYLYGKGIEPNIMKALELLSGVETDEALYTKAKCYLYGWGVDQNKDVARNLLLRLDNYNYKDAKQLRESLGEPKSTGWWIRKIIVGGLSGLIAFILLMKKKE